MFQVKEGGIFYFWEAEKKSGNRFITYALFLGGGMAVGWLEEEAILCRNEYFVGGFFQMRFHGSVGKLFFRSRGDFGRERGGGRVLFQFGALMSSSLR